MWISDQPARTPLHTWCSPVERVGYLKACISLLLVYTKYLRIHLFSCDDLSWKLNFQRRPVDRRGSSHLQGPYRMLHRYYGNPLFPKSLHVEYSPLRQAPRKVSRSRLLSCRCITAMDYMRMASAPASPLALSSFCPSGTSRSLLKLSQSSLLYSISPVPFPLMLMPTDFH